MNITYLGDENQKSILGNVLSTVNFVDQNYRQKHERLNCENRDIKTKFITNLINI